MGGGDSACGAGAGGGGAAVAAAVPAGRAAVAAAAPVVPAWAVELVGAAGDALSLTSVRVADAVAMGAEELEARVAGAYGEIAARLREGEIGRPVRLWN